MWHPRLGSNCCTWDSYKLVITPGTFRLSFKNKIYFVGAIVCVRLLDLPRLQAIDIAEKISGFKEVDFLHFFYGESNPGWNIFEV